MSLNIQRLSRPVALHVEIAQKLHDMIMEGIVNPGDNLPGQRELAEQFGASMSSVREAISVLSAAGLVEVSPGRGTVVCSMKNSQPQLEGWLGAAEGKEELIELLEARQVLETYQVIKVASEATPEEINRLRIRLKEMENAIGNAEKYDLADYNFHLELAEIAKNRVMIRMLKAVRLPMHRLFQESHARMIELHGDLSSSYKNHKNIVDAIAVHDEINAQKHLEFMFTRSKELISKMDNE